MLALAASAFAGYPGQLGVNIGSSERCGTYTNQVNDNYRFTDTAGADLVTGQTDSQGWPSIDCWYIVDWRPVAEWEGVIDDPEVYRCNMSGTYKCSFIGQATLTHIEGDFVVQNQVYSSSTNTTTFDVVVSSPGPGHGVMVLQFTNTKRTPASPTGTGITNLKIMYPGYQLNTTQIFTTAFTSCLTSANFGFIRFKDFLATDGVDTVYPATTEWANRKLTTDASQQSIPPIGKLSGGAWEYVIQIANTTGISPWVNIPVSASTDYVTQVATLLKNNLNSSLNIYVESSNEVWNSAYPYSVQRDWSIAQGVALGLTEHQNYARRTVELAQIFQSVFGAGSLNNRVRVMLCTHAPMLKWWMDDGSVNTMLPFINANYGPPKNFIYSIACQTYFGGAPAQGGSRYARYTVAQLLQAAHDDITAQINDTSSNQAGRMQWVAKAAAWQLVGGFSSYEGGPDYGGGDTTNIANRILCNRDPGMATEFKYNLDDAFFALGANLATQFTLTSSYQRYGCWGLTDDVTNPDRNYKFQAARDLLGTPTPPGQATNPSPANGATGVSTTADLIWTAGSGATSHDVYFGTVSPPPFKVNQTATTYDTGTMATSTTYYWRIDEKNDYGTTTGVVWSFTTGSGASVTLLQDGFETDFAKWTDGGTTDWDRATDQKYSGSYSAHAGNVDNDLISDNLDTSGKSSIRIEFWYRDDDIDDNDDIFLQLYNGSAYANRFELGNSTEDTWNKCDITINNSGGDIAYFISNFRIKFEGTSIDLGENLWIDDVLVTVQ